jgi:hypothetical protein
MTLKVPIYDAPQVKQQAAPLVGLNVNVPNLGAPLAEGINQAADVARQIHQSTTKARFVEFEAKAATFLEAQRIHASRTPAKDLLSPPGADGKSASDVYKENWENFSAEQMKLAKGNPQLEEAVRASNISHGANLEKSIMQIRYQANEKYKDSANTGGFETAVKNVAKNPFSEDAFREATALAELSVKSKLEGLSPELVASRVADAKSTLLTTRVKSLLDTVGGTALAKKTMETFPDIKIDPAVEAKVNARYDVVRADIVATEVFGDGKKPLADTLAEGTAKVGDNPEAIAQFKHALKSKYDVQEYDKKVQEKSGQSAVDGWVAEQSRIPSFKTIYDKAVAMPAEGGMGLTPTDAKSIAHWWSGEAYTRQQRAKANAETRSAGTTKDMLDTVNAVYADPVAFAAVDVPAVTYADVREKSTPQEWGSFINTWQKLRNDKALTQQLSVDKDELAALMVDKGYLTSEVPKAGSAEKKRLEAAQAYAIKLLQPMRAHGAVITAADKTKAMNSAMVSVTTPTGLFGWNKTQPAFEAAPTLVRDGKTYILHSDGKYYLSEAKK